MALIPPFVVLLKDCKINYIGRAKAISEGGTFLFIAKKDRTIILHSLEKGIRPVYYNPSKDLTTILENGILKVNSISKIGERLSVIGNVDKMMDVHEGSISGDRYFESRIGTEKMMVQQLKKDPTIIGLLKEDFEGAEVRISSGRIDLLFKNVIVEVKKRAGARSFDQLSRYLRGSEQRLGIIVCIKATETLKNAIKNSTNIRLIERPEWTVYDDELPKQNY